MLQMKEETINYLADVLVKAYLDCKKIEEGVGKTPLQRMSLLEVQALGVAIDWLETEQREKLDEPFRKKIRYIDNFSSPSAIDITIKSKLQAYYQFQCVKQIEDNSKEFLNNEYLSLAEITSLQQVISETFKNTANHPFLSDLFGFKSTYNATDANSLMIAFLYQYYADRLNWLYPLTGQKSIPPGTNLDKINLAIEVFKSFKEKRQFKEKTDEKFVTNVLAELLPKKPPPTKKIKRIESYLQSQKPTDKKPADAPSAAVPTVGDSPLLANKVAWLERKIHQESSWSNAGSMSARKTSSGVGDVPLAPFGSFSSAHNEIEFSVKGVGSTNLDFYSAPIDPVPGEEDYPPANGRTSVREELTSSIEPLYIDIEGLPDEEHSSEGSEDSRQESQLKSHDDDSSAFNSIQSADAQAEDANEGEGSSPTLEKEDGNSIILSKEEDSASESELDSTTLAVELLDPVLPIEDTGNDSRDSSEPPNPSWFKQDNPRTDPLRVVHEGQEVWLRFEIEEVYFLPQIAEGSAYSIPGSDDCNWTTYRFKNTHGWRLAGNVHVGIVIIDNSASSSFLAKLVREESTFASGHDAEQLGSWQIFDKATREWTLVEDEATQTKCNRLKTKWFSKNSVTEKAKDSLGTSFDLDSTRVFRKDNSSEEKLIAVAGSVSDVLTTESGSKGDRALERRRRKDNKTPLKTEQPAPAPGASSPLSSNTSKPNFLKKLASIIPGRKTKTEVEDSSSNRSGGNNHSPKKSSKDSDKRKKKEKKKNKSDKKIPMSIPTSLRTEYSAPVTPPKPPAQGQIWPQEEVIKRRLLTPSVKSPAINSAVIPTPNTAHFSSAKKYPTTDPILVIDKEKGLRLRFEIRGQQLFPQICDYSQYSFPEEKDWRYYRPQDSKFLGWQFAPDGVIILDRSVVPNLLVKKEVPLSSTYHEGPQWQIFDSQTARWRIIENEETKNKYEDLEKVVFKKEALGQDTESPSDVSLPTEIVATDNTEEKSITATSHSAFPPEEEQQEEAVAGPQRDPSSLNEEENEAKATVTFPPGSQIKHDQEGESLSSQVAEITAEAPPPAPASPVPEESSNPSSAISINEIIPESVPVLPAVSARDEPAAVSEPTIPTLLLPELPNATQVVIEKTTLDGEKRDREGGSSDSERANKVRLSPVPVSPAASAEAESAAVLSSPVGTTSDLSWVATLTDTTESLETHLLEPKLQQTSEFAPQPQNYQKTDPIKVVHEGKVVCLRFEIKEQQFIPQICDYSAHRFSEENDWQDCQLQANNFGWVLVTNGASTGFIILDTSEDAHFLVREEMSSPLMQTYVSKPSSRWQFFDAESKSWKDVEDDNILSRCNALKKKLFEKNSPVADSGAGPVELKRSHTDSSPKEAKDEIPSSGSDSDSTGRKRTEFSLDSNRIEDIPADSNLLDLENPPLKPLGLERSEIGSESLDDLSPSTVPRLEEDPGSLSESERPNDALPSSVSKPPAATSPAPVVNSGNSLLGPAPAPRAPATTEEDNTSTSSSSGSSSESSPSGTKKERPLAITKKEGSVRPELSAETGAASRHAATAPSSAELGSVPRPAATSASLVETGSISRPAPTSASVPELGSVVRPAATSASLVETGSISRPDPTSASVPELGSVIRPGATSAALAGTGAVLAPTSPVPKSSVLPPITKTPLRIISPGTSSATLISSSTGTKPLTPSTSSPAVSSTKIEPAASTPVSSKEPTSWKPAQAKMLGVQGSDKSPISTNPAAPKLGARSKLGLPPTSTPIEAKQPLPQQTLRPAPAPVTKTEQSRLKTGGNSSGSSSSGNSSSSESDSGSSSKHEDKNPSPTKRGSTGLKAPTTSSSANVDKKKPKPSKEKPKRTASSTRPVAQSLSRLPTGEKSQASGTGIDLIEQRLWSQAKTYYSNLNNKGNKPERGRQRWVANANKYKTQPAALKTRIYHDKISVMSNNAMDQVLQETKREKFTQAVNYLKMAALENGIAQKNIRITLKNVADGDLLLIRDICKVEKVRLDGNLLPRLSKIRPDQSSSFGESKSRIFPPPSNSSTSSRGSGASPSTSAKAPSFRNGK